MALGFAITGFAITCATTHVAQAEDWLRFRGPEGTGVVEKTKATAVFKNENIKWTADLPGAGSSCPIIVGDKLFLTCYSGFGLDKQAPGNAEDLVRHLLCINPKDGSIIWNKPVKSTSDEDPYKGFIQEHGYASSTPTSDGKHVFVFFGKTGVLAFDLEGNQLWQTNMGTMSDPAKWGGGSSLILVDDLLIVNAANEGRKLAALDKATGKEVWKIEDEEFGNCWSTPIIVQGKDRTELVISMPGKILSMDPKTGKEFWRAKSPITGTVCASLVQNEGVVFAMGGRGGVGIAVRTGGTGDVSGTHTVWEQPLRAGIGTPIIKDGKMFWSSRGIAYCVNCEDGETLYQERLPSSSSVQGQQRGPTGDYASPVILGDQMLILTRSGRGLVIQANENFKLLGETGFSDDPGPFNASPAVTDQEMFIRSDKKLYCIQ